MGVLWTDERKKKHNHRLQLNRMRCYEGYVSRMFMERRARGWSLVYVASLVGGGICHGTIRAIERWDNGTTVEREKAIGEVFGMSFDDLMRADKEKP